MEFGKFPLEALTDGSLHPLTVVDIDLFEHRKFILKPPHSVQNRLDFSLLRVSLLWVSPPPAPVTHVVLRGGPI